uniref:Uncharacterized protein n=1 Tax=Arundo donax TaxID=35708 RepID=A0A0A8XU68_ARUDO
MLNISYVTRRLESNHSTSFSSFVKRISIKITPINTFSVFLPRRHGQHNTTTKPHTQFCSTKLVTCFSTTANAYMIHLWSHKIQTLFLFFEIFSLP